MTHGQHSKLAHRYEILSFSSHDHLPASNTSLTPCWEQLMILMCFFVLFCFFFTQVHGSYAREISNLIRGVQECHTNLMTF